MKHEHTSYIFLTFIAYRTAKHRKSDISVFEGASPVRTALTKDRNLHTRIRGQIRPDQ